MQQFITMVQWLSGYCPLDLSVKEKHFPQKDCVSTIWG